MENPIVPENPYAAPQWQDDRFKDGKSPFAGDIASPQAGWGKVNQVRTVAVLSGVHGVIEMVVAAFLIGMGMFMPFVLKAAPPPQRAGEPSPEAIGWILLAVYGGMGVWTLLVAILRVYAAYCLYGFRRRVLGIVAMIVGLSTSLSCYCFPIGLLIYGLIILFDVHVQAAFEMRAKGLTVDQVMAHFVPYRLPPQSSTTSTGM